MITTIINYLSSESAKFESIKEQLEQLRTAIQELETTSELKCTNCGTAGLMVYRDLEVYSCWEQVRKLEDENADLMNMTRWN